MKDEICKKRGPYNSLSHPEQKKNKSRTQKARRQAGKKLCRDW